MNIEKRLETENTVTQNWVTFLLLSYVYIWGLLWLSYCVCTVAKGKLGSYFHIETVTTSVCEKYSHTILTNTHQQEWSIFPGHGVFLFSYVAVFLIGDIGGQMGLFIGASILTILELFDYAYEVSVKLLFSHSFSHIAVETSYYTCTQLFKRLLQFLLVQ